MVRSRVLYRRTTKSRWFRIRFSPRQRGTVRLATSARGHGKLVRWYWYIYRHGHYRHVHPRAISLRLGAQRSRVIGIGVEAQADGIQIITAAGTSKAIASRTPPKNECRQRERRTERAPTPGAYFTHKAGPHVLRNSSKPRVYLPSRPFK